MNTEKSGPLQGPPIFSHTVPKRLVLGLGNDILTDDSIGLRVAAELRQRSSNVPNLAVLQTSEMGLSLLDLVAGYDELVIIDAVQTGKAEPGFVHNFSPEDLPASAFVAPHFLGLGEVLAVGRKLGLAVPVRVRIFAVEVQDPHTVGIGLSPQLQALFPAIVERILTEIQPDHPFSEGPTFLGPP